MNKEPFGLYIFRYIVNLAMLAFMAMLYWSSVLIEEDIRDLRLEYADFKNEIFALQGELGQIKGELSNRSLDTVEPSAEVQNNVKNGPQKKDAYPNLLLEDPFYLTTLPKLLGPNFKPHGTFYQASVGKYANLHPFSNWGEVSAWTGLCSVSVSKGLFGKYETLSPDMAVKMELRNQQGTDLPELWVHLRDGVFWHPLKRKFFPEGFELAQQFLRKQPVTAHDFKFYYDAMMNPAVSEMGAVSQRTYYEDVKEIEVIDNLTFVVRWNTKNVDENGHAIPKMRYIAKLLTGGLRPLPSFVYKYYADGNKIVEDDSNPDTYRTNTVWGQTFSRHWANQVIVSCGAWVFDGKTDRQITFKRNPDFYFPLANLMEGLEIQFKDSPSNVWQDFKANKLDTYRIQPDQIAELESFMKSSQYAEQEKQGSAIKRLEYVVRQFSYVGWNEAKPYFSSKKVRQALAMAIDRKRIIQQILNGLGIEITAPFYPFSPSYDTSIKPWPFDPTAAKRLLEQEGWYDSEGDGVLHKTIDGKSIPFRFSLIYYVKNPQTKIICEYISTALKQIGIICDLNGVELADLSAAADDKSFDALFLAWGLGSPPEEPRQLWSSAGAKQKGSSNFIGFANAEIDEIINKLDYEYDQQKRYVLYHRFCQIIHEEAPYLFLYTPKTILLYRDRVQNVFIPADHQDLVPGANVAEPDESVFWLKTKG